MKNLIVSVFALALAQETTTSPDTKAPEDLRVDNRILLPEVQNNTRILKDLPAVVKIDFFDEISKEAARLRKIDRSSNYIPQTYGHIKGMSITKTEKTILNRMCRLRFTYDSCKSNTPADTVTYQTLES